jgi:H+/Cl- antiporter ClcA
MTQIQDRAKRVRWWLWGAILAFVVVEVLVTFDVYYHEMNHGNDGQEIFFSSSLLSLIFSLPTGLLVALLGWLIQKLLTKKS